jgi:hypothetical protein
VGAARRRLAAHSFVVCCIVLDALNRLMADATAAPVGAAVVYLAERRRGER